MADFSIRRPVFITCIFILILAVGGLSLKMLAVDLFPDVTFPIVTVTTAYPGSGPGEVENLVSKKIEEELSSISGIKALRSVSREGVSVVIAEFNLKIDIKYAEQQVRDRTAAVRNKLPDDIEEPVIRRVDPADQPILILSLSSKIELTEAELFDLADQVVKPRIEQVEQVGLVDILGGRKREIRVELDLNRLRDFDVSASVIRDRLGTSGKNVPAGKVDKDALSSVYRTMGEFNSVQEIEHVPINFFNNENAVRLGQVAKVIDGLEEEKSRTYVNGRKGLLLQVFRQSGSNTVAVADGIKKQLIKINEEIGAKGTVSIVRDGAKPIRANIADVNESIGIGMILTIVVVYFFLASLRSTFITSLALPNSMLGAFILMAAAGFSINIMTLLALSLAVGLLIDDAIVVRENIFRHLEMGKSPKDAARDGTNEVIMAVVATTMTVIAVFGPIGFLQGVVGQFFKEFGLTICFAMLISMFDALTMAPMMSAYFAGKAHGHAEPKTAIGRFMNRVLKSFDRFQTRLEERYVSSLRWTMRAPMVVLGGAFVIFVFSIVVMKWIPKTFLPPQDNAEFAVAIDLKPGTSLAAMSALAEEIDSKIIRTNPEVLDSILIIGDRDGESNKASYFVTLVDAKKRQVNTSEMKERLREQLKPYSYANPIVKDNDAVGGGQRPFNLNIVGQDMAQLEEIAQKVMAKMKNHPGLKDVDLNYRPGKPEVQVVIDPVRAQQIGVLTSAVGNELRALFEGVVPAVFREEGREYDIRIRLREDQRDIAERLRQLKVPNMNQRLTNITNLARIKTTTGPTSINREDRQRYISVMADIAPDGPGLGGVMTDVATMFQDEIKLPPGMRYRFSGQAENFAELMINMVIAMGLGVLFIYLVLASLYESFVIPFTIMLVLPLAACGAFYALFITQSSLDLFSMIGVVMLLGIATKNSIILVDYIHQQVEKGKDVKEAIFEAGRTRLRPILMTSFALIAGMLPVAIGLNEASKQRTSMGIAIIGGLVSSTLLTLLVVPAAYTYIERFRLWTNRVFVKLGGGDAESLNTATKDGKR
jgi:HAE1 family hydrophobic/amphiphilic exporter-1